MERGGPTAMGLSGCGIPEVDTGLSMAQPSEYHHEYTLSNNAPSDTSKLLENLFAVFIVVIMIEMSYISQEVNKLIRHAFTPSSPGELSQADQQESLEIGAVLQRTSVTRLE